MLVDLRRAIWWVPVALVITNCFVVGNFVSTVMSALDRKSTRRNSSHLGISYAVFCLKKEKTQLGAAESHLTPPNGDVARTWSARGTPARPICVDDSMHPGIPVRLAHIITSLDARGHS